ncbi:hypothetical protein BGZ76_011866 [Entomortierella beljakovae]|nr:hypothetical protein BGZ76_011866 [Entomortierella beljakovae]
MIIIIVNLSTGVFQSSGVYFAVWLLAGLVGAVVSFFLWHVGIVLTGAYGAFVVVAVLFTAGNVTNYVFRYTVLAIVVVAGGYLTKRYERKAVILATSVAGAYCIMFGLDMFVQTGFRATFHVMLSQSTKGFYPVAGTWVMIACVPVIAAFGVYWELTHHEEPVGSWWFGHGAKPLPPLPGEKPPRRCCGFLLSLPSSQSKDKILPSESDSTLVPTPAKKSVIATVFPCLEKREKSPKKPENTTTQNTLPSTAESNTTTSDAPAQTIEKTKSDVEVVNEKPTDSSTADGSSSTIPPPIEKGVLIGRETIGHTGVHKVVIHREEHEFSVDLDEHL